jgi:ribosomal protein L23
MALFTKKTKETTHSKASAQGVDFVSRPVIIRPHTTEKSLRNGSRRQYTFVIDPRISKQEAARQIEKMYNVHIIGTTVTVIVSAKPRFRGVVGGKQRVKKITVTLAPGEHIDITGTS